MKSNLIHSLLAVILTASSCCLASQAATVAGSNIQSQNNAIQTEGQSRNIASISLSGMWEVDLGDGILHRIVLPGSLDEQGVSPKVMDQAMDRLSRDHRFVGKAIYTREIEIPADWAGKCIHFYFERSMWKTSLSVDGNFVNSQESLSSPHQFDLRGLKPGKHRLQIEVDNSAIYFLGTWSHGYSEWIQTLWNGLIGKIELTATGPAWIDDVQVYPDLAKKSARVVGTLKNGSMSDASVKATLRWNVGIINNSSTDSIQGGNLDVVSSLKDGKFEFLIDLSQKFKTWDEFSPNLYQLQLKLGSKDWSNAPKTVQFGMSEFRTKGGQFTINGRPTYLRGNHDGGNFPLTGYPSCELKDWLRIMDVLKSYGLNHIRFHSWTPPEAAFTAADQKGVYIGTELPIFSARAGLLQRGEHGTREAFLRAELDRILKTYGNHPSFVLMPMGNELKGDYSMLDEWTKYARDTDPRRLFSATANPEAWGYYTPQKWDQFTVAHAWKDKNRKRHDRRLIGNGETLTDFTESLEGLTVPIVSHEVGQPYIYPNVQEIKKYTGLQKPRNFEAYRESAKKHGILEQNAELALASAKLAVLVYRDEIERQLRTPKYGGFQLLDLHDYPGQGTALIGLLDAFWETKGAITPEEFSHFCGPVVPLARLRKVIWSNNEKLSAQIDLAQYGAADLKGVQAAVQLLDKKGSVLAKEKLPVQDVATGTLTTLGKIEFKLSNITTPQQLVLKVSIPSLKVENSWRVWVYPSGISPNNGTILVTDSWKAALESLRAGGSVLWLANKQAGTHPLTFEPPFWTPGWYGYKSRSCGLLIDAKHPAFGKFPTDSFTDWQWYSLAQGGSIMNLNELPSNLKPLVQVIDSPLFNWRLGSVIEGKVGKGKLLVCTLNLDPKDSTTASNQLRLSLLDYMNSSQFKPSIELSERLPEQLFSIDGGNAKSLGAKVLSEPGAATEELDIRLVALGGNALKNVLPNGADAIINKDVAKGIFSQPAGPPYAIVYGFSATQSFQNCSLAATEFDGQTVPKKTVKDFEISASSDGKNWSEPFKGSFDPAQPFNKFQMGNPLSGKYFKLVLKNAQDGGKEISIGQLDLR
jgi:hypothetical protein